MTDQIAGVCPVCNVEIMRPWRNSSQAFGRQTLIHFACLATWNRVIGAWHTEIADRPVVEPEQPAEAKRDLTDTMANRRYALDVAEWCERELVVARATGNVETRPFVQNAELIIKALREFGGAT